MWPFARLQAEPHLGHNEAVVRPAIGIADRLGHQQVLSTVLSDENIVQPPPASRSRVYPDRLLLHRQAGRCCIAWSQSEFDSKFKKFDPRPKVASKPPVSQSLSVPSTTPQPSPPISPAPEVPETPVPHTAPYSATSDVRLKKKAHSQSRPFLRQLLCCVSKYREPAESEKTVITKGSDGKSSSLAVPTPVDAGTVNNKSSSTRSKIQGASSKEFTGSSEPTAIRDRQKGRLRSLFRRKSRSHVPDVVLCRVTKTQTNQIDNRLKVTTPTLLVTRHDALSDSTCLPSQAVSGPPLFAFTEKKQPNDNDAKIDLSDDASFDYDHPLNADRLANHDEFGSDSASEESLHTEDSFTEPFDQPCSPGTNLLGKPSEDCVGKKCLVLDLDETLVHSSFKQVDNADFSVIVDIENIQHEVLVCKRPHLETFIETVGPLFECVMFTASLSKYADPVCDRIDPMGHFKHRLFREACLCFKNNYIKHLEVLGRDIDQICIIDNSPISFYFHRQNALQIVSWFDDPCDTALLDLIPYLKGLAAAPSVINYLQTCPPPCSAAIAQPEPTSWLYLPSDVNGVYDDEDDEEEVPADPQQASSQKQPGTERVIAMACRPGETVAS
ncbi:hypothetical protein SprV_0200741900 [Sparganum proliferum]